MREAQTMKQLHHGNVLPLHCSFVHKHHLWMVMPYISGGSVLNIMKYAFPEVRSVQRSAGTQMLPHSPAPCPSMHTP